MHNDQRQEPGLDSTSGLVNAPRRRLFKGVGGGAGVLLAVSAKTALGAGICQSPSAMMSGNTSPRPGDGSTCSGGRSPGFWKVTQSFASWKPIGIPPAVPPTFISSARIQECASGVSGNIVLTDIETPGTILNDVFPGATAVVTPAVPLWWVLYKPTDAMFGTAERGQLLRHLSAAWLNSLYFTSSSAKYPMSPDQVRQIWRDLNMTGGYCPNVSCSVPWTPSQVVAYITGMYDINSPDVEMCKVSG